MTAATNRCDGSLQRTIDLWEPVSKAPCPVCRELVAVVPIDGRPHLVEHRRRSADALPMGLGL